MFATAYGLTDTAGLVDAVLTVQEHGIDAVRRLAEQGHEPQATWVAEGHLDELRARLAWSQANRHLIDPMTAADRAPGGKWCGQPLEE
ncbi:hypothetical protein [Kitasatospora azatica]|uniref:hypothetical protein n=1 Tax=Kitasatospora azatica TaxID=58347 RepID=UPI00068925DB|nr:hypothetical protein [Kitasatospora azatica]